MTDLSALAAAARALLPAGAGVAATDPRGDHPAHPDEPLPGAVPARLREFRAGRAAARAAMADAGLPAVAIPMRPDRAPAFPPGLAASITHSRSACLAAVLRGVSGIGVDLEPAVALPPDVWEAVLLPAERSAIGGNAILGRLVFSAKEAAYKAQYAVSQCLFSFSTLHIALTDRRFTATFRDEIPGFPAGTVLHGHHTRVAGHILTAVVL